jgi:hypothetical protein
LEKQVAAHYVSHKQPRNWSELERVAAEGIGLSELDSNGREVIPNSQPVSMRGGSGSREADVVT